MSFSMQNVLDHFGLARRPFNLVPDPEFLFMSEQHHRAQAILDYGIMSRAPITLVTGSIGAGKTSILRDLLNKPSDAMTVGLIANAAPADRAEMLRLILYALGQPMPPAGSYAELYAQLETLLVDEYRAGRRVVLIFDEAQNLDRSSLEHLRLLTNINFAEHELVQLVLIGQPELRDMVTAPELKQLAQRISASVQLRGLGREDIGSYITHRLTIAGATRPIFDDGAMGQIHAASGGIPRLINQICDYALLYAFGSGQDMVDAGTVAAVLADDLLIRSSGDADTPREVYQAPRVAAG